MSAAMAAVAAFNAHAGFFIPKDTTMVMGMISPTESMTEIAYGVTRDTSVALGVSTMTNAARSYRWQMVHAQAMVAPYLADYEDVATFVGVQVKRRTNEPQTEVTPYLRLFKKRGGLTSG